MGHFVSFNSNPLIIDEKTESQRSLDIPLAKCGTPDFGFLTPCFYYRTALLS